MSETILDASAVLTLLQQEKGHEMVAELLLKGRCLICTVNVTEVITRLIDNGTSLADACAAVRLPNLEVQGFDLGLAQIAASLRPSTRALGLSLGDRACLALARAAGRAKVYTADAAWKRVAIQDVSIHLVR